MVGEKCERLQVGEGSTHSGYSLCATGGIYCISVAATPAWLHNGWTPSVIQQSLKGPDPCIDKENVNRLLSPS